MIINVRINLDEFCSFSSVFFVAAVINVEEAVVIDQVFKIHTASAVYVVHRSKEALT